MLLARLRWSAFGLRGRIVGAVIVTTAVSLGVAALVLLPRLEGSLQERGAEDAQEGREVNGVDASADLQTLANIQYWLIPEVGALPKPIRKQEPLAGLATDATASAAELHAALSSTCQHLGEANVALFGDIDSDRAMVS